ncbi:GntR family transcriptional regulator [Kitasatospora kifunensis]|uniref:GntR family transcriptional regulator n=1 Tax=Kitasatospora kifunensis TaxID=58351 RepID=A0A7W7R0J1_KITKI|nr:GntR family transcriptional regulator [Kitasatospora kifunensis]MBB4923207.1 GntR family transcriptional regulator [Kitasatospora kifunensis]
MTVIRNEALHKQVANAMRTAIADGTWPTDTQLPTETDLAELYGVSRPTVRLAVAALRSEGLLDVKQGRGTFVRTTIHGPAAAIEQTITRHGARFETSTDHWWTGDEEATVYRATTDATTAPLLGMDSDEMTIVVDRLIRDPATGIRAAHRLILPMVNIESTPLAQAPAVTPGKVYALLATAGHELTWRQQVSARIPTPDERTALRLSEAAALLVTHRVTVDQTQDQPLILERLLIGAESAALGFTIDAQVPAPRGSANAPRTAG